MRTVACAVAVLSLAAVLTGPAAAQSYGPQGDGYQSGPQSGPPPYYTDRSPPRAPDQGFDRPPQQPRGPQNAPWPQPGQNAGDPRQHPPVGAPERRIITETPPQRGPVASRAAGPSRVMIGPNEMVISIAEYEDLKNQARELERMRGGAQSDGRDYRPGYGPPPTYRQ